MKFAAVIEYSRDNEKIKAIFPAHRLYLRTFLDGGQLLAAGPFADDAGALNIYEAESPDQIDEWLRGDPFHAAGVSLTWQIYPLAYWSAKAAGPGKQTEATDEPIQD